MSSSVESAITRRDEASIARWRMDVVDIEGSSGVRVVEKSSKTFQVTEPIRKSMAV